MNEHPDFPYQAWHITPGMKISQKTIVGLQWPSGGWPSWHRSKTGQVYNWRESLFSSKEAAIAEGWQRLQKMEADLQKKAENIAKKRAALLKLEAGK